ncbi:hypothetical protein V7S43_002311 [Phytophthora oleae]|uniref:BZIP domain-containing protein n=1 Tax=Phytophthora oleae TaxID=2107226 RepID=A0ABD3G599_9STRA
MVPAKQFLYQDETFTWDATSPGTTQWKTNRNRAKFTALQRNSTYRRRRKEEVAILQQQVVELSRRLFQLKERKRTVKPCNGPTDEVALGVLKAIALRQCEKRLESKYRQQLFLSAINSQNAVIQDLEQVLKRKLQSEIKFDRIPSIDVKNARFYDAYFGSLTVLYGKLEEISSFIGFNPTFGKVFTGEPTKKMDGEAEYLEKVWVGTVPFTFQATCDAVWKLAAAPHRQHDRSVYQGLRDTENSIAVQYSIPFEGYCTMRSFQVARRYVESSRTVVVWRALSSAREVFPGISLDETGWCIIHAPKRETEVETLVQSCIRLSPMQFGGNSEEMMSQFIKVSMRMGVDDSLEIEHMMESLILDDALKNDEFEFDEIF